jgi:hypothetical protein
VTNHANDPIQINYAATSGRRRWNAPLWLAASSLVPLVLFVVMIDTADRWGRWFQIGQGWERVTGMTWIATAVYSLICAGAFSFARKRWYMIVALTVHGLFVVGTILPPGMFAVPWLMHWMHGPGA